MAANSTDLNRFAEMLWQSVADPRGTAQALLHRPVGGEALVLAFALVVVLNTLMFQLSLLGVAADDPLAALFANPVGFAAMQGGTLVASILALTWTGQLMGGTGRREQIALLLIWVQGLRICVQAATMVVTLISPAFGFLAIMAGSLAVLWVLTNFVDVAHGFNNLFRAILVLILGFVGLVVAVATVAGLVGLPISGMM